MKDKIQKQLTKIISEFTKEAIDIQVDVPEFQTQGDYTTNIALVLFGKIQSGKSSEGRRFKSSRELAEYIGEQWNSLPRQQAGFDSMVPSGNIEKVEVAGPGFINFWVNQRSLTENLSLILEKKDLYGTSDIELNCKIMIEFTDPNPFKEFHIGHLYVNMVGESISRLFESQGADVARASYQGDVGLHVAKAIWGMREKIKDQKSKIKTTDQNVNMETWTLSEQAKFLGESYARGSQAFEENETLKEEIKLLNKVIYEKKEAEVNKLYEMGRRWSLDYFESVYARLGTRFAYYYFESQVAETGVAIVEQHTGDVFEKSEGAVIFPGEKYGLHNRVFINSLGLPTYEAKDLALAFAKYKDFPYDASIIITANEQDDYFRVLLKALSLIDPDLAAKTSHISHGMVKLPSGKMSSRTGNVITGEWLLNETKHSMQAAYPDMDDTTSEMVTIAAIKYALLKSGIGPDLTFSIEESIALEGNSGPYLQYTAVRCKSILRKSEILNPKSKINTKYQIQNTKYEPEEEVLLRMLIHYPEVVEDAAVTYSPSTLCTYLFELAQKFNLFYQKHSILGKGAELRRDKGTRDKLLVVIPAEAGIQESIVGFESEGDSETSSERRNDVREFRLALTAAVGQVLQNGLHLLGISVPEKM